MTSDQAAADRRPPWDEYFMEICQVVARRATCSRRQVGAILVRDRRILTTGYNGPPRGLRHCEELGGCFRERIGVPSGERHELCRALHAEQNAIIQAALHGVQTPGSTMYVTSFPCSLCVKMLINAGVVRVVYRGHYPDELAAQMLAEAGVEARRWDGGGGADAE
jgi:dCMP deaminase